jgi:phosphoribosylglycinamide formyltransferase-1
MAAIIAAIDGRQIDALARVLISNNGQSRALGIAREAGIPTFHLSEKTAGTADALDRAMLDTLIHYAVAVVICSGYMKKIGPQTLAAFTGRILNVHPALLPAHGGQGMYGARVHAAVIAADETITGITVHVVDGEYDHGPILAQATVPVLLGDTIDSLAARVSAREKTLYVEVLKRIVGSGGRQGP